MRDRFIPEPTEPCDPFGLAGTAFYDEVPLSAVWMSYTESLTLADWGGA